MTVSATYTPSQYHGNGTTTAFGYSSPFFAPSDLVVSLYDTVAQAAMTAPVLNGSGDFDYTFTGTQDTDTGEYLGGGAIHFNTAPTSIMNITIERVPASTQETALTPNGPFPSKAIEAAFDRLTMLVQLLLSHSTRAIERPASDAILQMTLPVAAKRASQLLGFDASGNVIVAQPTGTLISGAMTAFVQSVSLAAAAALLAAAGGDVSPFLTKATGGTSLIALAARQGFVLTPQDFGAKADGATDDTAAIQAMVTYLCSIRASTASGGRGFFPPGFYKITAAISVTGAIVLQGSGRGVGAGTGNSGGTVIRTFSATADAFTVSTVQDVQFLDMRIDAGVVKSAGSGIAIAPGGANINLGSIIRGCAIAGFVDDIYLNSCGDYTIEANRLLDFSQCGIYDAATASNPDLGDSAIVNNTIWAQNTTPTDGCIRLDPAAGIAVMGNKLLGAVFGVRLTVSQGPTGTMTIVGNSIEQQTTSCIRVEQSTAGKNYGNIIIADNELSILSPPTPQSAIQIVAGVAQYISNVTIHDNILNMAHNAAFPQISVQDGTNVDVHDNVINLSGIAGPSGISTGGNVGAVFIRGNLFTGVTSASFYSGGLAATTRLDDTNGMTVAQLAAWANGSRVYVTDGHATNYAGGNLTVTGGGTGCHAFRQSGAWTTFQA